MYTLLFVIHVVAALAIVALVLFQHGKGADVGAAFGSGSAGRVFGASGSANFLSRATAILAVVFFLTSLGLTYFTTRKPDTAGVMKDAPIPSKSVPGGTTVPTPTGPPASKSLPGQIPGQSLPGQVPGQSAPAAAGPGPGTAQPAGPAPEGGKVQDVPK